MRSLSKRLSSTRRARQRGSVAIEYALILPALLLFVIGIMDTGRLIWTYTTLSRAAEAAARCAAINTTDCGTASQIKSYAAAQAWGLTITAAAFTVTTETCGIQVKGTYDFTFVIPAFTATFGTITLNATACYPA
jgi:Flp pilus assembly protein TadG